MYLKKTIKRFFRKLFCNHRIKDEIGYSRRRKKIVKQCCKCGKLFYINY